MRVVTLCVVMAFTGMTTGCTNDTNETMDSRPVTLANIPGEPLVAVESTVYLQNFEREPSGASGEYHYGEGRHGQGIQMALPGGRFDVDASGLDLGATGTIEWWAKPRPVTQGWWDQAWRYFLHVRPADAGGFQLDLSRHPIYQLRLSATMGMEPFQPIDYPDEKIEIDTRGLDIEQWQHMLVSWDLTGRQQRVWLLINGEGHQITVPGGTFTPGSFASIEFGNRPSGWQTPFIPMDGSIDDIHIRNTSVADRLVPH